MALAGYKRRKSALTAGPIVKTEAKKLKLENISPTQWISANARIMAELLRQGKLQQHQIPLYLSYTAKIGDLALRYAWQSVLAYDNEYI